MDHLASEPSSARAGRGDDEGFFGSISAHNRAIVDAVVAELARAIASAVRMRAAFFEHMDADNELALAILRQVRRSELIQ